MNDIDTLMSRIDEINQKQPPYSAQDIDTLIAYHRHNRARKASGDKGLKVSKPKVDLASVLGNLRPAKPVATGPSPFKIKF